MTGKETDPNHTEATVVLFFVIFVFIGFITAVAAGAVFSDTDYYCYIRLGGCVFQ